MTRATCKIRNSITSSVCLNRKELEPEEIKIHSVCCLYFNICNKKRALQNFSYRVLLTAAKFTWNCAGWAKRLQINKFKEDAKWQPRIAILSLFAQISTCSRFIKGKWQKEYGSIRNWNKSSDGGWGYQPGWYILH